MTSPSSAFPQDLCHQLSIILITSPSISNPDTTLIDTTLHSLHHLFSIDTNIDEAAICTEPHPRGECLKVNEDSSCDISGDSRNGCNRRCMDIYIIFDGYILSSTSSSQTKKGKITKDMEANYELYYQNILKKYNNTTTLFPNICCSEGETPLSSSFRYHIRKCPSHYGYAHAVKYGLELCQTPYALILQHDRKFMTSFPYLSSLLTLFESYSHIRYIGFPTVASMNHCMVLQCRYGLMPLVHEESSRIFLPSSIDRDCHSGSNLYEIQPIIFWYDSNHLCHVQRYLQIYSPFISLPPDLRGLLQARDRHIVSKLLLRKGDFIEDRFGQAQRNLLASLKDEPDLLIRTHQWFGSYLLYSRANDLTKEPNLPNIDGEDGIHPEDNSEESMNHLFVESRGSESLNQEHVKTTEINPFSKRSSCIMVSHLRGRHYDPHRIHWPVSRTIQVQQAIGEVDQSAGNTSDNISSIDVCIYEEDARDVDSTPSTSNNNL